VRKDWFKELFSDWLTSRPKLMVLSLVLAVVVWTFVALSVNSITTRTIDNVLVEIPSTGASYQSMGLDLIEGEVTEHRVSVTVSGDRSIIGMLTSDSITVTPDFSKVTEAGTYNITLNASRNNQLLNYEIKTVEPSSLVLTFGESAMRKFQIAPAVSGFTVADGYVAQPIVCSPGSVTVVGSRETVDRIRKVTAEGKMTGSLSSSASITGKIHLYDADNNEISSDMLRMDVTAVDLLVPIYKEGTVDFDIEFVNVPSGFDTSVLKYSLSPSTIRVAYAEGTAVPTAVRTVGYVDVATLDLGETYQFDVTLPSGYVDLDGVGTISVKFDPQGMESQKMTVTDIRASNVPEGYEVTVLTDHISGVNVIGDAETVAGLLPTSLVAVIDASVLRAEPGTQAVPVTILIPSSSTVWAVGTYTVNVEVVRK
jgi:YbbR domain-containing protein